MDPHTNSLEATEGQRDKAFREDPPLQTPVELALGAEQPYLDKESAGLAEANRATSELYRLSNVSSRTCRDPIAIQKCVTNGADVNFEKSDTDESILKKFCDMGNAEALKICLSSALPINFTDVRYKNSSIVTRILSSRLGSVDERVELLRAAVQHMAEHPEDTVDWSEKAIDWGAIELERVPLDFISLAAENQMLSAVWPVIRDVPYFADHVDPIRLTGDVWRWDFNALGADQSYFDTSSASWVEANRATRELYRLAKVRSRASRYWMAIQKCVTNGADINFRVRKTDLSILLTFFKANDVEAVRICLSSALPIDFTNRDDNGKTLLLHLLRIEYGSVEERVELLRAAVQHMAEHPEDRVDWSERAVDWSATELDRVPLDFISHAAQNQLLSAVWPVMRDVPYFAHRRGHIRLTGSVWRWDFKALGADQSYFDTSCASWVEANGATGELYRLALLSSRTSCDRIAIQKCVRNGADVNFKLSNTGLSILMRFCAAKDVEAVRICLSSALPIDFTDSYIKGETLLLRILRIEYGSVDERVELIRAAVQHMAKHPEDRVDWSQMRTDTKLDFITLAACRGMLSAVWPVIRDVPYFAHRRGHIRLTRGVWQWDFNALGADQSYFDTSSARWVEANRATGELYRLAEDSCGSCRDRIAIQKCVTNGADVNFKLSHWGLSILMKFCDAENAEAVRICLSSALRIDFSHCNFKAETLLLRILSIEFGSVDERVELIRAAVQHMAEHPEDKVDWSQTSGRLDFVSLAAENQLLSAVWPVIRDVPYFAHRRGRIALTGEVWWWDFNALGADQSYFDTSSASWCNVLSAKKLLCGNKRKRC